MAKDKINPDSYLVEFETVQGGYRVTYPDLPGCRAQGNTKAHAILNGYEAIEAWAQRYNDLGISCPLPGAYALKSGHIRFRVPRAIHKKIVSLATVSDLSMNRFMTDILREELSLLMGDQPKERLIAIHQTWQSMKGAAQDVLTPKAKDDQYSGEWNQRLDPKLHHAIDFFSKEQNVSMNCLMLTLVIQGITRRESAVVSTLHINKHPDLVS